MEAIKSLFYYLYCLVDFAIRQVWRWTLTVVLGLYVYLAVDILRQAASKSPAVLDLIHWRDPRKSGIVFGTTLVLLLSFTYFNIVTVLSYLGLILLAATLGYRVYVAVTATVNKTEQRNPFQPYLEKNLDLPQDKAHDHVDGLMKHAKELLVHLRRLFLVENYCESIKFALFLWSLTYVGEYVSGTTLVILAFIGIFTLPKIYELNKPQIDHYYNTAEQKLRPTIDTVKHQMDKFCCSKKAPTHPPIEPIHPTTQVIHEKAF